MLKFSFFIEELSDERKKVVDSWAVNRNPETTKFSDHVFGNSDRVIVPLEHIPVAPPTELLAHLRAHNYDIHDYRAGTAIDHHPGEPAKGRKHGRIVRIGAVLNQTNASPEIKSTFVNDKNRSAKRDDNLQVIISRHPYDVAEMSDHKDEQGKHSWASCLNSDHGVNKHYLQHAVEQGTHVAYLTEKGHQTVIRPIARIALQPYHHTDDSGNVTHTVLRPEFFRTEDPHDKSTYGDGGPLFDHTVRQWTETHFPVENGKVYYKNSHVYDDDRQKDVPLISNDHGTFDRLLGLDGQNPPTHDPRILRLIAQHGAKYHLDHLVNRFDSLHSLAGNNRHLPAAYVLGSTILQRGFPDHARHFLLNSSNMSLHGPALKHADADTINEYAKKTGPNSLEGASSQFLDVFGMHAKRTGATEAFNHLLTHDHHHFDSVVARYGNPDHVQQIYYKYRRKYAEAINRIPASIVDSVLHGAAANKLDDLGFRVAKEADSAGITPGGQTPFDRFLEAQHTERDVDDDNFSSLIDQYVNHKHPSARAAIVQRYPKHPKVVNMALNDQSLFVRARLAHKTNDPQVVDKLLNMRHPAVDSAFIARNYNNDDRAQSETKTQVYNHLMQRLNTLSVGNRLEMATHAPTVHLQTLAKDPDSYVARTAQRTLRNR